MSSLNKNCDYGLVSIIMPNYNSEKFLKSTVQSVLNQTYQNWELIIVDDCSTDNSLNVLALFCDDRIRIFKNYENLGAAKTRNKAIELSKGRWISFLDSDDLWQPEKLEKQLSFMIKNHIAFSCCDYDVINSSNEIKTTYSPTKNFYTYKDILKHNVIGCLTVVYDSYKLGKVYMPETATKREDFACWLSILKSGVNVYYFHESLAQYRIHSNSVSSNKLDMIKYQWSVYRKIEKLNFLISSYYLLCWAIKGLLKYK